MSALLLVPGSDALANSVVFLQNIIKKVSGQKFVYKFVSQPDPSLPDGTRGSEDGQKKDTCDPNSQLKGLGGGASACQSKGLLQVRPADRLLCHQAVM